jgi:HKD family nuclease
MELLAINLERRVFKELQRSKKNIVIISPFISLYTVEKLVEILNNKNVSCQFITRFERKAFISGASNLKALKLLVENGISVLALKDLHTKVYMIDQEACFVGSANFTRKGFTHNHELLMYLEELSEVEQVKAYIQDLLDSIQKSGDWRITLEQIEIETQNIEQYQQILKDDNILNEVWGADLNGVSVGNGEEIILSVPAGSTIHLIEKYYIHAHPVSKGYNYTETNYITFRKHGGGVMDHIYCIDQMFTVEMSRWQEIVGQLTIPTDTIDNISDYIVNRYKDFEFDKAPIYKFYVLSERYDLPNKPHPKANNAGGWLYTLEDLRQSKGVVNTVKKPKRI